MNLVCFATAWGPKFGGINAFNEDFALGLAQELGTTGRIFCAVPNPTPQERSVAAKSRITLIPIEDRPQLEMFDSNWVTNALAWLENHERGRVIDWWIGHDVISGHAALHASGMSGRAALIHHMSYDGIRA